MAKVNIKSEKITPFGGIYYASKAFYALSLDKVINGTLGVRSSTYNGCTFARGFRPCFRQDGKSRCDIFGALYISIIRHFFLVKKCFL